MKLNRTNINLQDDSRAVASVLGFIILFGFLVLALIGYQAQVIPQQNAETEFEHFQENQNELAELRSAILTAGSSDRSQYPTIELGTTYQTRTLGINGPPPSGLLHTSDVYEITISDGVEDIVLETRFIEYQPGYHELNIGSTWYENSVLYLETESDQEPVIIEDQQIVTDGDTLRITALQNKFQQSGTDRMTLELYPTSNKGNISDLANDKELTVNLPTRLSEGYWETQFDNSDAVTFDRIEESGVESVNGLRLTVDSIDNLEVNTIGLQQEPQGGPAKNNNPLGRNSNGDGGKENVDDGCEIPETDPDNTVTFEETRTLSLNGETNDSDIVFKDDGSRLQVKANGGSDAVIGGLVVFKGDYGETKIDSSENNRASVEDDIWMADDSELTGSGSLIKEGVCIGSDSFVELTSTEYDQVDIGGDVSMGDYSEFTGIAPLIKGSVSTGSRGIVKLETTEYYDAEIRRDVAVGSHSDITLTSTEYDPVDIHGDVLMGDDSELTGLAPLIEGSVNIGSGSSIILETTEYYQVDIHGDVLMGDDSELTGVAPLIEGSVSVGSGSSVTLETIEYGGAEIGQDIKYTGDGTLKLIDTEYGDPQINGQVVIDDDDATVEFILEDRGRLDDIDVVDGDGNVLDEDDNQVKLTTM